MLCLEGMSIGDRVRLAFSSSWCIVGLEIRVDALFLSKDV